MDSIRNIVIFKPKNVGWTKFTSMDANYSNGDKLLRFELKENGITAFETSDELQYLSVENKPLTGTTTLSLQDKKPVVLVQGSKYAWADCKLACSATNASYSTIPIISVNGDDLKLRFEPSTSSKNLKHIRYNIVEEEGGKLLGILLIQECFRHMTLAFEETATPTQKQIIVGMAALIISDRYRGQHVISMWILGIYLTFLIIIFLVFVPLLIILKARNIL